MKSNFEFLKQNYSEVYDAVIQAEDAVFKAPRTSAFYSRFAMERAVHWMYNNDSDLKLPYEQTLSALTHEFTFKETLAPGLFNKIFYIRKLGNVAVHNSTKIKEIESLTALKNLYVFVRWIYQTYSLDPKQLAKFDESLLVKGDEIDKTAKQLKELEEKLTEKDNEILKKQQDLIKTEEELKKLRVQISANKVRNREKVEGVEFSEDETRKLIIDILLREAGWDPNDKDVPEYEVSGMPNNKGIGFVDYVLWGDDGLPLAVVEAKKTQVDPKVGQRQAELYADCLEKEKGQRPVIFYSNGYQTWLWDDQFYSPREIQGFLTKDQLQRLINRRKDRKDLSTVDTDKKIAGRYYQVEAIKNVAETYQMGGRKALIVMATGTGKTRVSIATVEMLMKNGWARNVLFLADRTALVNQAKNSFREHLPNVSLVDLTKDKESTESRIVFSTYPTMMNCIDETKKDGEKRFGVGHFDLIVVDEAHRSVYMKYGSIFNYFDALLLGLTATPKDDVDKNTYELFNLEDNVPSYAYELKQAVEDEFLVPPKAIAVPLKFPQEGITYDELTEEEKAEYELTFRDEITEDIPDSIGSSAINDWLFNTDTVDKVLKHLVENGHKVKGGDVLGKTIIFAKNHNHAEFIKERFELHFPELKGKFLRVIDYSVKYVQSVIDDFSDKDKYPNIAVSVDMLDTGIDIPEAVNLVFFKPIKSKVKFWQMIGRGTRLCSDLYGPGEDKEDFYIFDYCGNFEFFNVNPDGVKTSVYDSLNTKIFKKRLILSKYLQASDYQNNEKTKVLYDSLIDNLHRQVSELDVNNFMVRPHRQYVDKFSVKKNWENLTDGDIADLMHHIASINMITYEDDETEKRFDLFILNLQLSIIEKHQSIERHQDQLVETAERLEKKANIPFINDKIALIKKIQEESYFSTTDIADLEMVRMELRSLIKFLDKKGRKRDETKTTFRDTLGEGTEIDDLIGYDASLKKYRKKVEEYLRAHRENVIIRKIQNGIPITLDDLEEIENLLLQITGAEDKEEFKKIYDGELSNLGIFIRRIVGLSRESAKELFAKYLDTNLYDSNQISFINQLINHVVKTGLLDPEDLYSTPFDDYHFLGVEGLFKEEELQGLFAKIENINSSVKVASEEEN